MAWELTLAARKSQRCFVTNMPFLAFISRIENLGEEGSKSSMQEKHIYSSHGRGFSVRIQAMVSLDRPAPVKSPYDRDVCAAAAADFAAGLGRLRRPAPPNSRIESEDNLVTLAPSLSHKYDVARSSRTREIQTIYCSTAGSFFNSNFIMRPLFSREENHTFLASTYYFIEILLRHYIYGTLEMRSSTARRMPPSN